MTMSHYLCPSHFDQWAMGITGGLGLITVSSHVLGIALQDLSWRDVHLVRDCRNIQIAIANAEATVAELDAQIAWENTATREALPALYALPLPQDLGVGVTVASGATLTQSGTGLVDQVMMGLAAVGVAVAAPEIAIPRAAAAGWRLAAGTL